MIERSIFLEGIDPVDFFGVNNANLDHIVKFFSKIKIVARGNELKIMGEEEELEKFETVVGHLIKHFNRYNRLTKDDIENVFHGEVSRKVKNDVLVYGNRGKIIRAEMPSQKIMVKKIVDNDLMLAIGPAGTGKTYMAVALAIRALKEKQVRKIILCRPAVEAGESLGFLPGDIKEKLDPYLQPLYDALNDMVPAQKLKDYFEEGIIQIAPLAYMRGRTLESAFVVLDEAQNATKNQLKMFLTRMGKHSKFIVTGDVTQIDLPKGKSSGLIEGLKILRGVKGIAIIEATEKDIMRHKLVKRIVDAYDKKDLEEAIEIKNNKE